MSNRFPANQDSDQSISDEEEFECHSLEHCVPFNGLSKREEPSLALRFELLEGGIEANERRKRIAKEKNAGCSSEDEVEMPVFNKGDINGEKRNYEEDYSSSLSKLHDKIISDAKQPSKLEQMSFTEGERSVNHSHSLHFQPCHQQVVWHSNPAEEVPDSPEQPQLGKSFLTVEYDSLEEEAADDVEGSKGKSICDSENVIAVEGFDELECAKQTINLLAGLQERICGQYSMPKRYRRKERKRKAAVNVNTSLTEKGIANEEDPFEIIDSGSSSDERSKDLIVQLTRPEAKQKTMADQFQEAIGATSVNEGALLLMPKQSRACNSGLLGKLQKVIQREKEQDLDFLRNVQSKIFEEEAGYIDVKILSRSFEAKLTVCVCSIHGFKKSSALVGKSEDERLMNTMTVIFSSRTCGDVELDPGSCVRVYPPWKEVKVLGGKVVILASYFTQTWN